MNNNRQSVNNFVYQKKNKTQNNNTQSVNNFVYNKNRSNDTSQPQPPIQPQRNNNYTSSNNYNSYVSENDYNYTSGYQPTNSYNNNLNNNQQTSQDYNASEHHQNNTSQPVEVHLPHDIKLSKIITIFAFVGAFLIILISVCVPSFENILLIITGISFLPGIASILVSPFIDRHQLKKVCSVPVTGQLVGYEQRRRSTHTKHHHHHYYVYAPKYQIFINNRYEIRTLDDFTRSSNRPASINLLANPNGYEIMPADGSLSQSGKGPITVVVIMLVIIAFFFVLAILFFILRRIIL